MLALDAIIANTDRHQDNILVQPVGNGLRVWAIDAGNAQVSAPSFTELDAESPLDVSRVARGIYFGRVVLDGALAAAQLAELLPVDWIESLVADAAGAHPPYDLTAITRALADDRSCGRARADGPREVNPDRLREDLTPKDMLRALPHPLVAA